MSEARVGAAHARQVAEIRARVVAAVLAMWAGLGEWRDRDVAGFAAAVAPVVTAGMAQTAAATVAYLEVLRRLAGAVDARPGAVPRPGYPRGVPVADVYRRPGGVLYGALADGVPFPAALEQATARLKQQAATDMQLAKTHTAREWMLSTPGVAGYRRLLSGTGSCDLCVAASRQRYRRSELLPIHPSCDCGVAPIFGDKDPGQVIESRTMGDGRLHGDKGVVVHDHGELGKVLAVEGHRFTGA